MAETEIERLRRREAELEVEMAHLRGVSEARERYRVIFDSAVDFAIIAIDREGRITDWNTGAERVLGWPAGEMLGEPVDRFFTPEDRAGDRPGIEMRCALESGRANDDRWHLRRDGSRFWAGGEMMPLKGEDGEHLGFLKILRDRTEQRRSAEALHEAQGLNTPILNSSRDCIVVLDLDGNTLFISPGGITALEVSDVDAILGLSWLRVWKDADGEAARAAVAEARAGGTGRFQGFCPTHKGTPKWWDVVISPLPDLVGRPERLVSVGRDITELKGSENRRIGLLELGDRLRDLEDPGEMAFAAAEIMGRAFGADRAGYGTIDADRETITIERDWTAPGVASLARTLHFRDFGSFIEDLKRGETVVFADAEQDPRTTATAGALKAISARSIVNLPIFERGIFVAMFYVNHASVRTWSPKDIGFVRNVADRTRAAVERCRADKRLQELNETLEREVAERTADRNRLWETTNDLMGTAGLDGYLKAVNPAWTRTLGWNEAELLTRPFQDLIDPADHAEIADVVRRLAAGETVTAFVDRLNRKDGTQRAVVWTAIPDGDVFHIVGRDITDLRQAEEQLRHAQKMEAVGQLTGGLAHDFNNLLTGITGSLELMQIRITQGRLGEIDRYVSVAQGAAKRAATLTHRLLAFSRRQTLDPKPTNVNRLVTGMEELIRRTMGPSVEIEVVGHAGLWTTLVDPNQLENALLNLCVNARDAMPEGGRLTVETANTWLDERTGRERDLPPGQYLSLSVTDTGTGMTPDVIKRAFDPFFTTKPIGMGTGLGLSMAYGFARQSGGQMRVYSELGRGTTMCIYLPRHHGREDGAETPAEPDEAPRAGQGRTVLVVDDEPTVRMLVAEVLEDLGFAAIEAADGAAGLRVLQSDARIDLLISDVGLPGGMNGRQMADAGRTARPGLKVMFITGYAENAVVGNGHLEPGMQVLTKPFAMDTLASRIRDLTAEA